MYMYMYGFCSFWRVAWRQAPVSYLRGWLIYLFDQQRLRRVSVCISVEGTHLI